MGWWIFLTVLLALALVPLGIRVSFDSGGFAAQVIAGPVKITVFPVKMREKKPGKEKTAEKAEKQEKTDASDTAGTTPREKTEEGASAQSGGSLERFLPWIRLGLDFLGDFRRKIRLNNLYLHVVLAGDDPCDLAVNYGRAWAAIGNLMPALERLFVIRKRDIQVSCDFAGTEIKIAAKGDMTITLGRTLCLGAIYGIRALKIFFATKRKGGAAA